MDSPLVAFTADSGYKEISLTSDEGPTGPRLLYHQ